MAMRSTTMARATVGTSCAATTRKAVLAPAHARRHASRAAMAPRVLGAAARRNGNGRSLRTRVNSGLFETTAPAEVNGASALRHPRPRAVWGLLVPHAPSVLLSRCIRRTPVPIACPLLRVQRGAGGWLGFRGAGACERDRTAPNCLRYRHWTIVRNPTTPRAVATMLHSRRAT
jgi:hypothetical protein